MGSQSFIMMYEAGSAWQYGKRRISALSNEEFNKLTPLSLLQEHSQLLRDAIPDIQKGMEDMSPLIRTIMVQFGEYIAKAIDAFPAAISAATGFNRGSLASVGSSQALVSGSSGAGITNLPTGQDLVNMLVAAQNQAKEAAGVSKPSTISGLSVQEAQQQARDKQIAFDKAKEDARLKSLKGISFLKETKQPVPQVRIGLTKKKAGQSQILERTKLMRAIASNTKLLKAGGVGNNLIQAYIKRIRGSQQQLVNLLARYRF